MLGVPFERHDIVRVAIVGTGLRGRSVLGELLAIEGVRITALADIVPEHAAQAARMITAKGQPAPALYTNGERDFEKLVQRDDIDFVYTATPWHWHTPVALAAMRAGKHAGHRSAKRTHGGRLLGAGEYIRAHAKALSADGELLLRGK